MIYLLILWCLFIFVVGMRCSNNNIFSPSVMTGAIWAFTLILFVTLGSKLPDLSLNFILCAFLWITGISFGSLYAQSATYRDSKLDKPGTLIRNIYLIASVLTFPKLIFFAKVAIANGASSNWAWNLRLAAIGQGSGFDEPFGGLFVIIWQVSLLMEFLCYERKKWWRLALIVFIYAAFGAITMSKITFLTLFLFGCTIFYFKKIITLKHLVIGLSVLLVFFLGLQSVRQAIKFSEANENIFVIYMVSNLSAFDTLEPCSTLHFGENTFRFCYAVFYKLGLSNIEPIDTLLKWVEKPIPTNTYTAMYPYYKDFGIIGLIIFPILMGITYGWLFKKAQKGSNFHILLYAAAANIIFMQYAADLFFTTFFGNVKLFFFLLLPFLASKHNLLVIKDRIQGHGN
ncbi:MAG: oligosaccharide repeat unit polymerase [Paludibacteraceae bacterium]|nr:oligosaccharide repeat unit polymerase [Paludibacteraceae bacterium]